MNLLNCQEKINYKDKRLLLFFNSGGYTILYRHVFYRNIIGIEFENIKYKDYFLSFRAETTFLFDRFFEDINITNIKEIYEKQINKEDEKLIKELIFKDIKKLATKYKNIKKEPNEDIYSYVISKILEDKLETPIGKNFNYVVCEFINDLMTLK